MSDCELTLTYSPAAILKDPATSPARDATAIGSKEEVAEATPTAILLTLSIPSLAPNTAARIQLDRLT